MTGPINSNFNNVPKINLPQNLNSSESNIGNPSRVKPSVHIGNPSRVKPSVHIGNPSESNIENPSELNIGDLLRAKSPIVSNDMKDTANRIRSLLD